MNRILILGASPNPERYAYKAANMLNNKGYEIVLLGKKTGTVFGKEIEKDPSKITDIDTVTIYLNPDNQKIYYDFLVDLKPRRVIFNPDTENPELEELLEKEGIEVVEACTLVLLSTNQF